MSFLTTKFKDILKNLKVDAVPRPPRPETDIGGEVPEPVSETNNENVDDASEYEEIIIGSDDSEKKKKYKKPFFSSKKKKNESYNSDPDDSGVTNSTINTQANAPVINIVNSKKIHIGDEFTYYTGNLAGPKNFSKTEEPIIPKCNLIILLMEAETKPADEYIDYVSKNLGKEWHSFFRVLGYTKGRIETVEIDEARYGVSEARYKLFLDWVNNNDDATLGKLATLLWEEGERQIVKELAIIYKKNKS